MHGTVYQLISGTASSGNSCAIKFGDCPSGRCELENVRDDSSAPLDKLCVTSVVDGGTLTEAGSPVQDAGSCGDGADCLDSGR